MSSMQTVSDLMEIAARTAPKAAGQDYVVVKVIEGQDLQRLGDEMAKYGQQVGKKNFDRDGRNVAASAALVLVGLKDGKSPDLNCGACGVDLCNDRIPLSTANSSVRSARSAYWIWESHWGRR